MDFVVRLLVSSHFLFISVCNALLRPCPDLGRGEPTAVFVTTFCDEL